jgi:hypothetical protein
MISKFQNKIKTVWEMFKSETSNNEQNKGVEILQYDNITIDNSESCPIASTNSFYQ